MCVFGVSPMTAERRHGATLPRRLLATSEICFHFDSQYKRRSLIITWLPIGRNGADIPNVLWGKFESWIWNGSRHQNPDLGFKSVDFNLNNKTWSMISRIIIQIYKNKWKLNISPLCLIFSAAPNPRSRRCRTEESEESVIPCSGLWEAVWVLTWPKPALHSKNSPSWSIFLC